MRAIERWLPIALLVGTTSCSDPPLVVQGTVVSVDDAAKTLSVQDETRADVTLVLSTVGADVGAPAEMGNVVRIAYRVRDGKPTALRVMNITKQAELRGDKGGH